MYIYILCGRLMIYKSCSFISKNNLASGVDKCRNRSSLRLCACVCVHVDSNVITPHTPHHPTTNVTTSLRNKRRGQQKKMVRVLNFLEGQRTIEAVFKTLSSDLIGWLMGITGIT